MKEDRRVRKTRSAIKSSFIELLNEKELEKITIQDIADRADINRGTFYLHYEDKYLLLSDMEDEFISQMTFLNHLHNIMGKDPEDTAKNFINIILKNMLQHISDNITFYQTILQLNRKSKLEEKIYSLIGENIQKYISTNHEIEGIPEKYFHSYVAGATISTVKFWVNDPHRLSVEDLTNHIFKIIYHGPLRIMVQHQYKALNIDTAK